MTNEQEVLPILPVGYRILIKQDLVDEKTNGGIIVASMHELERQQAGHSRGIVMAIGESAYHDKPNPWCKVGDRVMFPNYAGKKFKASELKNSFDKNDLQYWHIMNDEDVLGVINV